VIHMHVHLTQHWIHYLWKGITLV